MKLDYKINYEALRSWYLFANTPSYLYKHFRQDQSLQDFSEAYKVSQLIELFENAIDKEISNIDDLITIYAIIFALTFKDFAEVRDFFYCLEKYNIKWSYEISNIYLSSIKLTTSIVIKSKPLIWPNIYTSSPTISFIMSDNNFRYLCDPFRVEPFRLIYTVGFTYGYSHATLSGSNTKTYVHVKIGL